MITVLAEPGVITVGALLHLAPEEGHHLQVRRATSGDVVRVLDGHGAVGLGTLSIVRKDARVEITEARRVEAPPALVLAVGAGDRDRFAWTVEKGTELGVTGFVPLSSSRAGDVAGRLRPNHVEKLARRAMEACKQAGNPYAPVIHEPVAVSRFLADPPAGGRFLAAQDGGTFPATAARQPTTIMVGPEGGFAPEEEQQAREAGFQPVRLGPFTLRFETAAVAAAAVVAFHRNQS